MGIILKIKWINACKHLTQYLAHNKGIKIFILLFSYYQQWTNSYPGKLVFKKSLAINEPINSDKTRVYKFYILWNAQGKLLKCICFPPLKHSLFLWRESCISVKTVRQSINNWGGVNISTLNLQFPGLIYSQLKQD